MKNIITEQLQLSIDEQLLTTLNMLTERAAREQLATIWGAELGDLSHYYALFFNQNIQTVSDKDSFITLSFSSHGYVLEPTEHIDITEAEKQIAIDLEIINRESQWGEEESIYFDQWWPKPHYNSEKQVLEFGVSLKDYHQKVFNRTLNRLLLTRFGHILINYSLSEQDIADDKPLSAYQTKLDEVEKALNITESFRYQDVNEDTDSPSKSRMINLILSSEIF